MPEKDKDLRKRRDAARKAKKRALERGEAPPVGEPPRQVRDELLEGRKAEQEREVASACQVVDQVAHDKIDLEILKDRLIRELYPDVNEAVLRVMRNLGLVVDAGARLGEQLLAAAIEPLVTRALRQLGPVQLSEIPRAGSMDADAVAEMRMSQADTGALMLEMGRRKLLMVDPSLLTIQEARWLIQTGHQLELKNRQRIQEDERENSTRKFVHALMDDEPGDGNGASGGMTNIELINELMTRVDAAFSDPDDG